MQPFNNIYHMSSVCNCLSQAFDFPSDENDTKGQRSVNDGPEPPNEGKPISVKVPGPTKSKFYMVL